MRGAWGGPARGQWAAFECMGRSFVPHRFAVPRVLALSLLALPAVAVAQPPTSGVPVAQAANPEPIPVSVAAPVAAPQAEAPAPAPVADMPAPAAEPAPAPTVGPVASPIPGVPPKPEGVVITAPATISTGVVAIVNDFVISDYDLDQRIALFAATSGTQLTKETIAQIRSQVLRSMEDEVLELQEAAKHRHQGRRRQGDPEHRRRQ
jgi:hypothetical protein